MDAGVAHHPRDQLHAAVMSVEPHLAEKDAGTVRQVAAAVLLLDGGGRFGGGAHVRISVASHGAANREG
jgi:hypothetical protein